MKSVRFILAAPCVLALFISSTAFADTATIQLYVGTTLATSSVVTLPAPDAPDVDIMPTGSATTHPVPARSAIAVLEALDAETEDFDVTKLDYYDGMGFQASCFLIPSASSSPLCTTFPPSWLFAINGTAPTVGMSAVTLHDGDVMQVFYSDSSSRRTVVLTSPVTSGSPFTVQAQEIDPATGTYHTATGFTIDLGTASGYSFATLQSTTTDAEGKAIFTLDATGTYAVALQEDYDFPATSFTVDEPAPVVQSFGGGGGASAPLYPQFNLASALAFLLTRQHADGSFGAPIITDWTAIALSATGDSTLKTRVHEYLTSALLEMANITDHERRAMALESLGINPYSGTSENQIAAIVQAFDGTQIGDPSHINDDIFALIPLTHAGYTTNDDIITKTVAHIIAKQAPDGSWSESVDMTSAAIQALVPVRTLDGVENAITKARAYLHTQQQPNGGWGNSSATSWTLQAIAALSDSPSSFTPASTNPLAYLASTQQSDGAVDPVTASDDMRTWATAYAIPAALGTSWNNLLQSFAKPSTSSTGSANSAAATSTEATSTPSTATSTAPVTATSTEPITPPALIASSTATSTATTTPQLHTKKPLRKNTPPLRATITTTTTPASTIHPQIAGAGNTLSPHFLTSTWHTITSFFARIF